MKRYEGELFPAKSYQQSLNLNYDYFEKLRLTASELVTGEGTISTTDLLNIGSRERFDGCLIAIYAYNNCETVRKQLILLKDNIIDFEWHFAVIIFDDSTDYDVSQKLKELAISQNATYVKIPRLRKNKNLYYHNQAINYSWYNVLQYIPSTYIGMLDHDIFPYKKIDLWSMINNYDIYCKKGYIDLNDEDDRIWYPWPGFCFFKRSIIKEFNFFYDRYFDGTDWFVMDTGGSMFRSNFLHDNKNCKKKFVSCERIGNEQDFYEIVDDSWIHLRDLSNWSGNNIDKTNILNKFINNE